MRYAMIALVVAVMSAPLMGCHDTKTTEHNGMTGSTTTTHDMHGD